MGLLEGKVAIVTGAGGGIGRAEALLLATEGAKVVVNDVGGSRDGVGSGESAASKVVEEIRAVGGTAEPSFDDVASVEGASRIVQKAVDAFGRLDVLVNNAGILRDKTLLKMDEAMFDAVVRVHLKGTFLCTQAAARQMIAQGQSRGGAADPDQEWRGRIVNTTSVSGMMGNFGQANYAAAKAGIYGLTRTAAIELQKHRITVNAIAPIARTRMTEDLPMFQTGLEGLTPDHVAPAALFLGSDLCGERSGFVLAVAGSQMYAFKVVQTAGKLKDAGARWTAQEIADNWDAIFKGP
jgi:NAD(P)-dependent dehydrogenase (short-subunit alcohol dehydrogenase family)